MYKIPKYFKFVLDQTLYKTGIEITAMPTLAKYLPSPSPQTEVSDDHAFHVN